MKPTHPHYYQRGDVSLYITGLIVIIMIFSLIIMSSVLVRQRERTRDIEASERALYVTDVALERALFAFSKADPEVLRIEDMLGQVDFESTGDSAKYVINGVVDDLDPYHLCLLVEANYIGIRRRFKLGGEDCDETAEVPNTGAATGFLSPVVASNLSEQNPIDNFDVNNSGVITPIDALLIVNALNGVDLPETAIQPQLDVNGDGEITDEDAQDVIRELRERGVTEDPDTPSLDVNLDGNITPGDALLIVNFVNRNGEQPAEANPSLDLNEDGNITMADADIIIDALGGSDDGSDPGNSGANLQLHNSDKIGDVNGDGEVTPLDNLLLIKNIKLKGERTVLSNATAPLYLDVNGDGRITKLDIQVALNVLRGNSRSSDNGDNDNDDENFDVNEDGDVTNLDALIIIGFLRNNGDQPITGNNPNFDVNQDGFINGHDAEDIINSLR